MRNLISNPSVAQGARFLQKHYDLLLAKVNGNKTLLPDVATILDDIYGCGEFGCVWPVGDGKQVLKLSINDGSMDIIKALIKRPLPGLPKYHKIVVLEAPLARTKMRIPGIDETQTLGIWRENIFNVGHMPPTLQEACRLYTNALVMFINTIKFFNKGKLSANRVTERLEIFGKTIHDVSLASAGGPIYDGIIKCMIEHQVVLSDLHSGNTGQNSKGEWIVFDPIFYPFDGALCDKLLEYA